MFLGAINAFYDGVIIKYLERYILVKIIKNNKRIDSKSIHISKWYKLCKVENIRTGESHLEYCNKKNENI